VSAAGIRPIMLSDLDGVAPRWEDHQGPAAARSIQVGLLLSERDCDCLQAADRMASSEP
jgi:hypothetical protein